jgi:RNA polymerase primary sigma factor
MRQFKITERITPRSGKSIQKYFNDLEKCHPITIEEEIDLIRKAQLGDQRAKDKVISANLRFVISVAKMYSMDPEIFGDLVSAGNIGLIDSLDKFDSSKGFKFISYAVWHIRKEMLKYLSENTRTIKIPVNKVQELKLVFDMGAKIESELGREPSLEEILFRLQDSGDIRFKNMSVHTIQQMMEADIRPKSLDAPINTDSNSAVYEEMIGSEDPEIEGSMQAKTLRVMIERMITVLTPEEGEVVMRKHGIFPSSEGIEESFALIGTITGCSTETVRIRYNRSLIKLRKYLRKNNINPGQLLPGL